MHEGASPRISAKRGFSLVELVVALGVGLSILALVFPALSEARTLAVRSVTQSNLRQIGVATHAYASSIRRASRIRFQQKLDGTPG